MIPLPRPDPRTCARSLWVFGLLLAFRAGFSRVEILPGVLDFNPGVGLIPWAAAWAGAGAVPAAVLAALVGEFGLGTGGWGLGVSTAAGWGLWAGLAVWVGDRAGRRAAWWTLWPGVTAAAWIAWAVDARGWYPFAWVWGLAAAHHLVFAGVFSLALPVRPSRPGATDWAGLALRMLAAVAPPLVLLAIARAGYGVSPWATPMLGEATGTGFPALGLLVLLSPLLIVAMLRLRRRRPCSPALRPESHRYPYLHRPH